LLSRIIEFIDNPVVPSWFPPGFSYHHAAMSAPDTQFVYDLTDWQNRLFGYLVTLLGNVHDARDVLQETNLVMWRRMDTFTPGTDFGAWARKCAYFQAMAFLRDRKRGPSLLGEELLALIAEEQGNPAIDENERRMIDKLMTKLRSLVEETQIGLIGVVHLKRPDKGKSYNEGRQVSLTDLRGSAAIEQLSDTVAAMERNQQDESGCNYSQIRILKNRRVGLTGKADLLLYNHETGRMKTAPEELGTPCFTDETGRADF
jgi:hypothetical protein